MDLKIIDLGLIDFSLARKIQAQIFSEVKSGREKHALIICRHLPVVTLGRGADRKNILFPPEELQNKGISVCRIERGGDVTYHGPGQLTIYPVFNLNYLKKDIHWFLRFLEETVIECLDDSGIKARRREGLTGVWVSERKISSIGIAIRNWITFHGFSINIKRDDLANFSLIRPCGMDIMITSVESELGKDFQPEDLKRTAVNVFKDKVI